MGGLVRNWNWNHPWVLALEVTGTKPQVQFQTCFKTKIELNLSLNPILVLGFREFFLFEEVWSIFFIYDFHLCFLFLQAFVFKKRLRLLKLRCFKFCLKFSRSRKKKLDWNFTSNFKFFWGGVFQASNIDFK